MNIGFIGLGIMGKPMAKNLIKAGHKVTCYDHHQENLQEIQMASGEICDSEAAAAQNQDLIITMLPNGPQVREAVLGPSGILKTASPGTVFVDMSSIAPNTSQELYAACSQKGIEMLDAPVSGGEPKAIDGTLSIMAGGKESVFLQVKDVLLAMGSSAVYCGEIGAGNTTKLANQIIVALNIAAASEAFSLSTKAGVDPEKVFHAIKGGLAGSTVLNAKMPMILDRCFDPGFRIDLHIKDLNNAIETAHKVGSPIPLTVQVMEMMQQLHADNCGSNDHSALVKFYEKLSDTPIMSACSKRQKGRCD